MTEEEAEAAYNEKWDELEEEFKDEGLIRPRLLSSFTKEERESVAAPKVKGHK